MTRITASAFESALPGAAGALRSLTRIVDETGLDKKLTELLKVRVSQINGCAYCLKLHLDLARRVGVPAQQLELVAVWPEAAGFDERERAALAWAEALTRMAAAPVDDAVYAQASRHFTAAELAALTAAVATINAWNRIAGALRFAPA